MSIKKWWSRLKVLWNTPSVHEAMRAARLAADKVDSATQAWTIETEMNKRGFVYDMRKGAQSDVGAYTHDPDGAEKSLNPNT